MATNNKNFIVKNGLEVADSLIVANSSNSRVGFGTTSPLFPVDVRNTLALSGDMRVALDAGNPIVVNVTGSFSSLEPDVISGLTTTNIRIQDVITSDGKGYISPPTVIVSVGVNSVRLDKNHNLTSGTDTSALVISRKFDTVTGLSLPNNFTSKSPFEVLKLTTLLLLIQLNLSFWQ